MCVCLCVCVHEREIDREACVFFVHTTADENVATGLDEVQKKEFDNNKNQILKFMQVFVHFHALPPNYMTCPQLLILIPSRSNYDGETIQRDVHIPIAAIISFL